MEVKEEKLPEKMIPVFTVLKNGAILKNIFIVNSRDFSSPERNSSTSRDDNDDEAEETLIVGRHPDCDILLTHPSISRFHFEIRSFPSRRKLFLTDLSSVHGTWVTDQKVEPGGCVEVKEGDVIRIGGSTRIYRLHWIPLSRAYDIDSPFVSPLDAITAMEQEKENRILEAEELLEIARQPLENTASGDDRDLYLDATSEGTGSSAPSEDEETSVTARDILLPLQPLAKTASGDDRNLHLDLTSEVTGSSVPSEDVDISVTTEEILLQLASPSVLTRTRDSELKLDEDLQISTIRDLDFVDSAAEKPSSSCSQSKQDQSGGTPEDLGCSELDSAAEAGDRDLHLDVTSEGTGSSVPSEDEDVSVTLASPSVLTLTRDSELNFSEDVQGSTKWDLDVESVAEKPTSNSCSESEQQQSGGTPEHLDCSELDFDAEADEFDDRGNGGLHLNVMSEWMASPVTYVDEDLYLSARKTSSLQPLTGTIVVETVDLTEDVQASPELAISSSERMESPVTYGDEDQYLAAKNTSSLQPPTDTIVVETLKLTEDAQPSPELAVNILVSNAEGPRSGSTSKGQGDCCFEAPGCSAFDLATDVGTLSTGETKFFTMEVSCETLTKAEIQRHKDCEETESRVEILAEEIQGLVISEVPSGMAIETESENLHQESNGEAKVGSRQASPVSDRLLAGYEHRSRINAEDTQSLCVSWQALNTSEVGAPSEIWSEVKPAEDQNQETGMTKETENIFGEGSSACLSEELKDNDGTQSLFLTPIQKPVTEWAIGSRRSEESYSLSKTKSEAYTDKGSPFFSILAAETFEDTEPVEEPTSESTGSQERKILQACSVRDDELSEMDSTRSSSTCNIWSRRGKADSILQLRTNKSEGKQKRNGKQPKGQLNRKQTISDKSISLAVHHVAEMLEPEIFTPDKENLTPTSHMLKRLHEIGDVKDNKSSSKLSGKSSSSLKTPSSITVVTSVALTEPEIFTPNKENLTPNSHMLKRLRDVGEIKETKGSSSKAIRKRFFDMHVGENVMAEQKPNRHSTNSKPKVKKHELVEAKKKIERAPFQPLFEKSLSQSYTEVSATASARNKLSRGIRSSSILSDAKSKTKWTIVLDTSSLLDKESRKPLHLLQGLKGTHLVVPRTVLRELNETKRGGSLIFGRRRREIASSALDWIEECKVNTKWWIQIQCSSEETKATAPTPPVTPQSSSAFPFSLPDIESPTSEDQVLECALLYRHRNSDEKLVLLSNDVTLKIKAMAEGVICETAPEFYESLANPLSERFMWRESLPRGRTWSQQDDVVLREKFRNNGSSGAKGLKLILLHNSHYGHVQ